MDDIITSAVQLVDTHTTQALDEGEGTNDGTREDFVTTTDGPASGEFLSEITEAERESDSDSRLKILVGLLSLACAMVHSSIQSRTTLNLY